MCCCQLRISRHSVTTSVTSDVIARALQRNKGSWPRCVNIVTAEIEVLHEWRAWGAHWVCWVHTEVGITLIGEHGQCLLTVVRPV